MARRYEDYGARESAAIIISECVLNGESTGWSGGRIISEVEKICADYNVHYVDDFFGSWKKK